MKPRVQLCQISSTGSSVFPMQPLLISYTVLQQEHANFLGIYFYLVLYVYWFGIRNVAGLTNFTVYLLITKLSKSLSCWDLSTRSGAMTTRSVLYEWSIHWSDLKIETRRLSLLFTTWKQSSHLSAMTAEYPNTWDSSTMRDFILNKKITMTLNMINLKWLWWRRDGQWFYIEMTQGEKRFKI